jgi:hypothetical protein
MGGARNANVMVIMMWVQFSLVKERWAAVCRAHVQDDILKTLHYLLLLTVGLKL